MPVDGQSVHYRESSSRPSEDQGPPTVELAPRAPDTGAGAVAGAGADVDAAVAAGTIPAGTEVALGPCLVGCLNV